MRSTECPSNVFCICCALKIHLGQRLRSDPTVRALGNPRENHDPAVIQRQNVRRGLSYVIVYVADDLCTLHIRHLIQNKYEHSESAIFRRGSCNPNPVSVAVNPYCNHCQGAYGTAAYCEPNSPLARAMGSRLPAPRYYSQRQSAAASEVVKRRCPGL